MARKSNTIVGICVSQFSDAPDLFEFLIAYSDGREIGKAVSRSVLERLRDDLNNEFEQRERGLGLR